MAQQPEQKLIYGALTVYRERGNYLRKRERMDQSRVAYDQAFKGDPSDVRLLIGRSHLCSDRMEPEQAMSDAQQALGIQPHNMEARKVLAEAMYMKTDFERSIVINHRGAAYRKQPPYYTEGMIKGIQTVQNCVGDEAGPVMTKFLPLIKQQEELRGHGDLDIGQKHVSRIPKVENELKMSTAEARKRAVLSRVLAMKYLGEMAYDKFYLQELLQNASIQSANRKGSQELENLIQTSLDSIYKRQDMLRAQRPYYSISYAERSKSHHLTRYRKITLENERKVNASNADRFLERMNKCLRDGRVMDLIAIAKRMQSCLDKKTHRTLPRLDEYTDRLYKYVGEGYLSQYCLSPKLSDQSNRRRICYLMGIPTGRPTSYDSVLAKYPHKFVDVQKTIDKMTSELEVRDNKYMRCYFYYELAKMLNKRKNFGLSKFYAIQCQREAQKVYCPIWWLNGCFALMSGDMQQGNVNEVHVIVEGAIPWAKILKETGNDIIKFLKECAVLTEEIITGDETLAAVQREKDILKIMDEETRLKTDILLRDIARVPPGRRFSVMPTRRENQSDASERRHYYQRHLTVVPGPPKALRRTPKTEIRGLQVFES